MAFQASNFAVVSPSGIIPAQTLQSGSVLGAPGLYTYQSTDSLATIAAADYFESLANILFAGDFIFVDGSDGTGIYQVSSSTKDPQSVSIALFSGQSGNISLPSGGYLRFFNPANTFYSQFSEGVSSANKTYTWPLTAPSVNGQVLSCTTAGVMSWATASSGGLTWNVITGTSSAMTANNGYVPNNAGLVTLTMPATASVGQVFAVNGLGAGGWLLQMNTGQIANFGASPTSSAGSLASTNRYDAVELLCVVANTTFVARSSIGNLTVA